jgi:hypothetical protein
MKLSPLSCLLFALVLGSCSQSSNTSLNGNTQSAVPWVIPNSGTAFVYELTGINPKVHPVDTIFILTTGQHLGGKTGVIGCEDKAGTAGTFFYNIEENGDISDGDSTTNSHGVTTFTWTTFPTGSLKPIADPVIDTVESGIHIFRSNLRTFVDTEQLTTLAGTFSTLHVREVSISINHSNDSLNFNASDTTVMDKWYAPSIGLYAKVVSSGTSNGQPFDQSETDLIKYLPK